MDYTKMIDIELLDLELKKNKLSYRKLANHLGIDYSTLYRKMTGVSEFNRKEIIATVDLLKIKNGNLIFFPNWLA